MNSIMDLLERFVVAHEVLAAAAKRVADDISEDAPKCKGATAAEAEAAKVAEVEELTRPTVTGKSDAEIEREAMMDYMTKHGIKFKASARTETLAKLIAEYDAKLPDNQPVAKQEAATATKDMARDALVTLASKKGKTAALGILKGVGKNEKLSDVDPSLYGAIVAACGEA